MQWWCHLGPDLPQKLHGNQQGPELNFSFLSSWLVPECVGGGGGGHSVSLEALTSAQQHKVLGLGSGVYIM